MHTVTVGEEEIMEHGVLHRDLSCTCNWTGHTTGLRSESMARHHILFTHGSGDISFMGSVTQLRGQFSDR